MVTFPLNELYSKLDESEKQKIAQNRKARVKRLKGDFDKHAARILKMARYCRADEEVMWLKQLRPDIPKYKCRMLEWQLLAKFNVAKYAAWTNMRKLLLPAPGQYRKANDPPHSEICAHLFHIICIEVMGNDRVMNRIREFVRCFTDEELSRFIHSAAEFKRDRIPTYFVGFMLLRPTLIESQKDHIIEQMKGSVHKYAGFERICRLMAGLKFCIYTPEQVDVLAECFVREIEDMYVLKEKEPISSDLDNVGSCARHRENEQKMTTETFLFFKEYCRIRELCNDSIGNVGDLICAIPTDTAQAPIRRVLTYAFLSHRRMVPSIEDRKIMGIWTKECEWGADLSGESQAMRDARKGDAEGAGFSYHACFVSLARFINRFDIKSEGFKLAIAQAGGDAMVRLIALALLYESQYEKALEIIDTFLNGRTYGEIPSLHFTRLLILIRLKKFDEAIGLALKALFHAEKKSWTSSSTAPILPQNSQVDESDGEGEGLDEYLDDVDEEVKKSNVHLITERDTALCTCHLLVNIIRSRWREKEDKGATYFQVLIILSQLNFAYSGRKLFNELISEIEKKKVLHAPSLLFSLQNRFMIAAFSRIFHRSIDTRIVVCNEMNEKVGTSDEERQKYKSEILEIFQRAQIEAKEDAETLIPSISKFIAQHSVDIFSGIGENEGKEFVMDVETKDEEKEEKKETKTEEIVELKEEEEEEEQDEEMESDEEVKKEDEENEVEERTVEETMETEETGEAMEKDKEEEEQQTEPGAEVTLGDEVEEVEKMDTGEAVEGEEAAPEIESPESPEIELIEAETVKSSEA